MSTPTPAPTATPSPSPVPASVRWDRIGTIADSGYVTTAVGFDDGYVAIDWGPAVQSSLDGVTWTRVRLPLGKGATLEARSVATDGKRVVVVGSYTPCRMAAWEASPFGDCRRRPASWVSDDGRTWRASGPWTGPVGELGRNGSGFHSTWVVPGGWDAAQAFDLSDESDDFDEVGPSALWHSTDGLAWSLFRAIPAEPTDYCDPYFVAATFWAVADGDGRRVAHEGSSCEVGSFLSVSTDGRRYERLDGFPRTSNTWVSSGLAPIGSSPWVFVGNISGEGPMSWASDNLSVWTKTLLPVPPGAFASSVSALGHGGAGYVATGGDGPDAYPRHSITWLSDDGMTWRVAAVTTPAEAEDLIGAIADGPAGMLGFGTRCDDSDCEKVTTVVWKLARIR